MSTTSATSAVRPPARLTVMDITPAPAPGSALTTCAAVAVRTIRKFVRTPQQMVVATLQAALFLVMFRYAFGGAIGGQLGVVVRTARVPYIDFLVPGYVVGGVLFSGAGAAAGVAEDVERGVSDRLRSLPVPRGALLAGRSVADTVLLTWGMAVATAVGFLIGFRIHGGIAAAVVAFGLCIVYGFAFTWVFISIGLIAGSAQAAQGLSMLIFPLMLLSSAYVPVGTMPGWMQVVAERQPITAMTNAVRSLALGDPALAGLGESTGYWVAASLAWSAGLVAVFAPLAVARYRST